MRRAWPILLLLGGLARADESDYRPENEGWNGLSELFAVARSAGIRPEMRAEIDWDDLKSDDGLVILYPRVEPDGGRLQRFVQGGGRALVADDFGAAAGVFAALGLERTEPEAAELFEGIAALPVAQAEPHALTSGIDKVVGNHAAAFRAGTGRPVLSFSSGSMLCVDVDLGRGHLYALADPSVLINNMLELHGNRAFAYNLVAQLARPGGRLVVVTQEFAERGQPHALDSGEHGGVRTALGSLGEFNGFLKDLGTWLPTDGALRAMATLAALASLGLFGLLPLGRRPEDRWVRPFALATELPLAGLLREEIQERLAREDDERLRNLLLELEGRVSQRRLRAIARELLA